MANPTECLGRRKMEVSSESIQVSIGDIFSIVINNWGISSISEPDSNILQFISRTDVEPPEGMAGAGTTTTLTYRAIGAGTTSVVVTGNVVDFPDTFEHTVHVNVGNSDGIASMVTGFMILIMTMFMMMGMITPMIKGMTSSVHPKYGLSKRERTL